MNEIGTNMISQLEAATVTASTSATTTGQLSSDATFIVLNLVVSSLVALGGVYLGAKLTDRSSKRTEMRNEYLYCVSILQRLASEMMKTLSDFISRYDAFDEEWKKGKRDLIHPVRALELNAEANQILREPGTFSYLSCYEGFKKSRGLDFLPATATVPLTSDNQLNDILTRIYLQAEGLRGMSVTPDVSAFREKMEAIRDCLKNCQQPIVKMDTIVKSRYSRVIEAS
jgi:hypothetical protein